jgi:lipopolysaccharide/colanic/teichoic acid biosynthesis glycosyltransferase
MWNIAADPRVSRIGHMLRRTSIDELPQLWNIVRGQMSLVGPRPERPTFVERFEQEHERYWARHRVPVGLTGLAQVNGLRGDTSISDRARFDNYYIANWSLWLDAKVLLLTLREVFGGRGR